MVSNVNESNSKGTYLEHLAGTGMCIELPAQHIAITFSTRQWLDNWTS